MRVETYDAGKASAWNDFVDSSKNGTFLFNRQFMDYHSQRFNDASLMFFDNHDNIAGLLPANADGSVIHSHGGLTYGGLVVGPRAVQATVDAMLLLAIECYSRRGFSTLEYAPTPHIYHTMPAEEDLYFLFRAGGVLSRRAVSSALCPAFHPKQRQSRRGGVVRAMKSGVVVEEVKNAGAAEMEEFHTVLTNVLRERHGVNPVHSLHEMQLLSGRFPNNIHLFVSKLHCEVMAGAWVFESTRVAHTQYLAATEEGRRLGAEDLLIDYLISSRYADKPWFDFGISTENRGRYLNSSLIFQKEGFGARAVCYDAYTLDLRSLNKDLEDLR